MRNPAMIHVCPSEPDFDLQAFTVTERICAELVDVRNEAIVAACIRAAREAGITQLYLLDKRFICEAIREKIERETEQEEEHDPRECRFFQRCYGGDRCEGTKELDFCEGEKCQRWKSKEE